MAKSNVLKKITDNAKRIRKLHPKMTWQEAIKKSSAQIKKDVKAAPVKKVAAKKVITVKKPVNKKKSVHKGSFVMGKTDKTAGQSIVQLRRYAELIKHKEHLITQLNVIKVQTHLTPAERKRKAVIIRSYRKHIDEIKKQIASQKKLI
jgi:hypothetical protein